MIRIKDDLFHNVFSDRRSRHPSCVLYISDGDHKHLFSFAFLPQSFFQRPIMTVYLTSMSPLVLSP